MKHILIVDDNKTNLLSAQKALADSYKVTAVTMGRQALSFLEHNTCDLILLDINMPEMDGYEVMDEIRKLEAHKNTPIIFLTSDNDIETETKCLEQGAVDFIVKPFVKRVMCSRISRTLELEELRANLADRLQQKTREVIEMQSKSQKDALTGLWNRAYTEETVNQRLAGGEHGALLMMDLDNFKAINDLYGHLSGDATLQMLADTLRKYAASQDVLCRIGGDEFIVYMADVSSEAECGNRASDIIADMCHKLKESKFETNSSVSVGIAQAPYDGTDFQALYNAADKALYHVKQNGKNGFHFFREQKAAEEKRTGNKVDLEYLKSVMSRSDAGRGAYLLDFDSFRHVYNFMRRFVERSGEEVQTLLFTAVTDDETAVLPNEDLETALQMMEKAIYTSLRRVDISTRYSGKQIIVILLDSGYEDSKMVASRIMDCFTHLYIGGKVHFEYDIASIDGIER